MNKKLGAYSILGGFLLAILVMIAYIGISAYGLGVGLLWTVGIVGGSILLSYLLSLAMRWLYEAQSEEREKAFKQMNDELDKMMNEMIKDIEKSEKPVKKATPKKVRKAKSTKATPKKVKKTTK